MSTGDRSVNIYLKKFLPQQQMVDNFQHLLKKQTEDLYSRVFPASGVFQGGVLSSSVANTISISTPLEGTDSLGNDVVFDPIYASNIPFENLNAVPYYVGIQAIQIPNGIETNVRTGKLKYTFIEELVGEKADPNLVEDNGNGTIKVRVNSVTEAGVTNAGRTVRIFLKATEDGGNIGPQSLITYFENCTVQFDGTHNFIQTLSGLGQNSTNISINPADYQVVLIGASIKKNTNISLIDHVISLGIVTGAGIGNIPSVFDQSSRRRLTTGSSGLSAQTLALFETVGTVKHSASVLGQITWTQPLFYRPLGVAGEIQINASNITLTDGEVAYIEIPVPFASGTQGLLVADRSDGVLASFDRYWIFRRVGDLIYVRGNVTLEPGEERQISDIVIGNSVFFSDDDKIRFTDSNGVYHFDKQASTDNADIAIGSSVYFGNPLNNTRLLHSAGLLTFLYNNAIVGSSVAAGKFSTQRTTGTDDVFEALVTGDVVGRLVVNANGELEWSDGASPADTDLFRESAGVLATTNILKTIVGQLYLNDITLTRTTASLLTISSNLRTLLDTITINDITLNRESATLLTIASNLKSTLGTLTLNDINLVRSSATLLTIDSNITATLGTLTLQDIAITRTSTTLLTIASNLRTTLDTLTINDITLTRSSATLLTVASNITSTLGTLTLNDIAITRTSATLLTIASNLRTTLDTLTINDITLTRSSATLLTIASNITSTLGTLTLNDITISRTSATLITIAANLASTLGTLTLNDVNIARESATLIGVLADIRSSTGVYRFGDFVNNDYIAFVDGGSPRFVFSTNNVIRASMYEDGDYVVTRDVTTFTKNTYTKPSTSAAVTGVNASLNEVFDRTRSRDLLRPTCSAASKVVTIGSATATLSSGEKVSLLKANSQKSLFTTGNINFATGVVTPGNDFTPYVASSTARYFRYGVVLDENDDIVVILPTSDTATEGAATYPEMSGGTPVMIVTCLSNGVLSGQIADVAEENILFFGASGSGGGSGGVSKTFNISNNQVVEADVTGFLIDSTKNKAFNADVLIKRSDIGYESTTFAANTLSKLDGGVHCITIQPDGKILLGGFFSNWGFDTRNGLVRLNVDGTEDTTYGVNIGSGLEGGVFGYAAAIGVQSDGNVVIGGDFLTFNGTSSNRLARTSDSGYFDFGFAANIGTGFTGTSVNAIAIQSDDKILVGGDFTALNGNTRNRLVRLNSDGTEDTAFYTNLGTGFNIIVNSIVVQPDGKILVAGNFTTLNGVSKVRLVRLNSDGTQDVSFYTNLGTSFTSLDIYNLSLQADDKIIVSGAFTALNGNTRNRIVRLNSDGTEDTAFYTNLGTGFNNHVRVTFVYPNGSILVGGDFTALNGNTRNRLVRLNSDGTEDTTFYTNLGAGGMSDRVRRIAVTSDNKVIIGGDFTSIGGVTKVCLVKYRYNYNNEVDTVMTIKGFYKELTGVWHIGEGTSIGDDTGVTLTMTNSGQLQYTTTDFEAVSVYSYIKFMIRGL